MKKLCIGLIVLVGSASLFGMNQDIIEMTSLEGELSPETLKIKRALDMGTLNLLKADMIVADVFKPNPLIPQEEFRLLMDAYKPNIISNADKALDTVIPSYRKLHHLRGALRLLIAVAPAAEADNLRELNDRLYLQIGDHPALKEINKVKSALDRGTLTYSLIQDFLFSPEHNAGYYADADRFERYKAGTFDKARRLLAAGRLSDVAYDNIIAELILFDLFSSQADQTIARNLKKQIIQKYFDNARRGLTEKAVPLPRVTETKVPLPKVAEEDKN